MNRDVLLQLASLVQGDSANTSPCVFDDSPNKPNIRGTNVDVGEVVEFIRYITEREFYIRHLNDIFREYFSGTDINIDVEMVYESFVTREKALRSEVQKNDDDISTDKFQYVVQKFKEQGISFLNDQRKQLLLDKTRQYSFVLVDSYSVDRSSAVILSKFALDRILRTEEKKKLSGCASDAVRRLMPAMNVGGVAAEVTRFLKENNITSIASDERSFLNYEIDVDFVMSGGGKKVWVLAKHQNLQDLIRQLTSLL